MCLYVLVLRSLLQHRAKVYPPSSKQIHTHAYTQKYTQAFAKWCIVSLHNLILENGGKGSHSHALRLSASPKPGPAQPVWPRAPATWPLKVSAPIVCLFALGP